MAVSFSSQAVVSGLSNPTSLQFGPDGRLYVAQQDGLIRIYDVTSPAPGQWSAAEVQAIDLVRSLPNHDDDGTPNSGLVERQVTGLLVSGSAANPVLYVTSSDPRIGNFSDLGLDTNSGILSRLTWTGAAWSKVDLVRGLPRSEENHSSNGMVLSADGSKLYLAQGGNTNNGAPSQFFSNTPEYALDAAILEIDLPALEALPTKTFTYANGVTSAYKYDLPTLDDPTVLNNGAAGNETAGGLDVGGPFGGNDGLNQTILPADAPIRLFATGLRNAYDIVLTAAGKLFTIDNGSNDGLGGTPILDAAGRPTNLFNNGGVGSLDFLYQLADGAYYGHPVPTRGNQAGAIYAYSDGAEPQVVASIGNAAAAVPGGLQIAPGYVIDPSRFTASAARLAQEGQYSAGQQALVQFGASTNGLMEYTADAFGGEIKGDLIAASFDGTLRLVQMAADGVTVQGVTTIATPGGTPLDLVQGPNGSIWVAQIGAGQVLALSPSAQATASDPDIDDDGLSNAVDPFQSDAANGFGTYLASNASLNWNFQFGSGNSAPGPSGLFLGLTGHMVNGVRDYVAPVAEGGLDLANVKIGTAAGGGLLVVEKVSSGTASGSANTGEFLFQTGLAVAADVQTFTVKWSAINPYPALAAAPTLREIGGYIGTGDQSDFLKVVASPGGFLFQLEGNNATLASQSLDVPGVATAPVDSSLVFELLVNRATSQATPAVTYSGNGGPVKVTGNPISLAGTPILAAIDGTREIEGRDSGLAVGLWSSNTGEGSQNTFQATFDDILVTSTGPADQLVKAVNVGGGQVTTGSGVVFQADPGPSSGASASQVYATTAGIAGTTDDALYQDERWTPGGSYTYEVAVANGTYRVDLLFAEIYNGIAGAGQRVFDMALEGQALAALQNIDVYSKVGANAAYTISQSVTVSDGSLSLQVGPGSASPGNVENAKLNAFAIYGTTGGTPAPPTLSIAAANASQNEGNSGSTAFTFTVSRTGDTAGLSTAAYAVTGTGTNPASAADFAGAAFPSGTVSFAAGETTKTVTVNVAGDTAVEATETFLVSLSTPSSGTVLGTASATATILNDDSTGTTGAARLLITPGTGLNASTYTEPSYELTNTGTTAIRTLTIDLQDSLVAGTVFDPFGTFGDTTALDVTPYGAVPVAATWAFGPSPVTDGGYRTLDVTFGGDGLAAGKTFAFRLDADPASIDGPSPGPNEAGSISGFEHVGASVGVGLVDGSALQGEVFTQGSAGGGLATLLASPGSAPVLTLATVAGVPLVTDAVDGILKANLPGLNDLAGTPGNDLVVGVTGMPGQTVRLALAELGGVGTDIALGSHEGNTVLQAPAFLDVVLDGSGTGSVALALPAETPTSSLAAGSVSGRYAVTAAAIDPATGAATSEVAETLVVRDAPNSFTSDPASDTFTFRQGFATTDIFQFVATGANHDLVGLDQDLFPGQTIQQVLESNALRAGPGAGDVDMVPATGNAIHLHDSTGQLTVDLLRANPGDFFFV